MCGYAEATRYEFSQAANNFSAVEFAGVVGFAGLGNINTGQRTHTRQIFSAVILVKKRRTVEWQTDQKQAWEQA